jgi:hypothetical protein
MSWGVGSTMVLPEDWSRSVTFKLMKQGDRIGYIDTIPAKMSYKLVTAGQKPLNAFGPKMPFECPTVASIHSANKLTISIKLNERIWHSLDNLDREFDRFLLDNRQKLFGAAEADYLAKNPSAISLKRNKRLAPVDPLGQPIFDAKVTLRVNGRTAEVEAVQTAEGPRGTYISGVTWSPRTTPLPPTATRFSMITGFTTDNGKTLPIARDTLTVAANSFRNFGAPHIRFVGPGDMANKCLVHHALIRPAYWTCMAGGFMITLAADHVIFENTEGDENTTDAHGGTRPMPEGFARDPHEDGVPHSASVSAAGGGDSAAGAAIEPFSSTSSQRRIAPAPEPKRRNIMFETPGRANTGGAAAAEEDTSVGSSSFRALNRANAHTLFGLGEGGEEEDVE